MTETMSNKKDIGIWEETPIYKISARLKRRQNNRTIAISISLIIFCFLTMLGLASLPKDGNWFIKALSYKIGEISPFGVALVLTFAFGILLYINEVFWRPYYTLTLVKDVDQLRLLVENDEKTTIIQENIVGYDFDEYEWLEYWSFVQAGFKELFHFTHIDGHLLSLKTDSKNILLLETSFDLDDFYHAPKEINRKISKHDYACCCLSGNPDNILMQMHDFVSRFFGNGNNG